MDRPKQVQPPGRRTRAYATVITLVFLAIGTTMAAGFYGMLTASIGIASNDQASIKALTSAESGLQYIQYQLIKASTQSTLTSSSDTWLASLASNLNSNLREDGVITSTQQIYYNSQTHNNNTYRFSVPGTGSITLKDGSTFSGTVEPNGAMTGVVLKVTGTVSQGTQTLSQRTIWLSFNAVPPTPTDTSGFAMVAKGTISIGGAASIDGWDPNTGLPNLLRGRIYTPWGIGNGAVVALLSPIAPDLVFNNPAPLNIPNIDVSFLDGYKGSKLAMYTVPPGNNNETLTNKYIPANTNRTFSNNVTINGILYVEWPNTLTFNANVTINGAIVYKNKPQGNTATSAITFSRSSTVTNSTTQSKTQLNNVGLTADQLTALSGWTILAPNTDLNLIPGNSATKAFGGSLHVNNLNKATGQGNADGSLRLNRANIICEGDVDMTGNRVFWILPPGNLADSDSLGNNNYLYSVSDAYYEP
jgi:hypothetical protein